MLGADFTAHFAVLRAAGTCAHSAQGFFIQRDVESFQPAASGLGSRVGHCFLVQPMVTLPLLGGCPGPHPL